MGGTLNVVPARSSGGGGHREQAFVSRGVRASINAGLCGELPSRHHHRLGHQGDRVASSAALGEREVAVVDLAMFDAVNSIERRYQPYLVQLPTTEPTSRDAAAASAAATALALLHPQAANDFKTALVQYLNGVSAPAAAIEAGTRLGDAVAHKIVESRATDGADFNSNIGKVRLLYIVGPTCGICLRGLADLQEALYSKKGNDPRMITYVVHVPTLGARELNVGPASRLITNAHTTQYWEETGITGKLMEETLGLTKRYIWDFYAIYGPTAVWSDERPPVPDSYQHQLQGLPPERRLQADAFAAKVNEFLVQPAAAANSPANAAGKSE